MVRRGCRITLGCSYVSSVFASGRATESERRGVAGVRLSVFEEGV